MRSLLLKSSLAILIILAAGSGLTLAAASSEPGMFLYPIKRTTQRWAGALGDVAAGQATTIQSPATEPIPQPAVGDDAPASAPATPAPVTATPFGENQERQETEDTPTPQAVEAIVTPAPTPGQVTDEISVTLRAGNDLSSGVDAPSNADGSQAGNPDDGQSHDRPDSAEDNPSPDNSQPESSSDHEEQGNDGSDSQSRDSGDDQHSQDPDKN